MSRDFTTTFLIVFVGFVLTGAALILSIPPLFGSHEPYQAWMTGVLGGLAVAFAAAVLLLRPTRPLPPERRSVGKPPR